MKSSASRGMVPRNWCMANILEGLDEIHDPSRLFRKYRAYKAYLQINRWKALLPQNWLLMD